MDRWEDLRVDRWAGPRVDRWVDRWEDLRVDRWVGRLGDLRVDRLVDRLEGLRVDHLVDRMGARSGGLKVVVTPGVKGERAVGLEPSQAWIRARERSRASTEREGGRPLGVRALVLKRVEG